LHVVRVAKTRHVFDVDDGAAAIDERNREGQQRVVHPVRLARLEGVHEEHAAVGRQVGAIHEAELVLLGGSSELEIQPRVCIDLDHCIRRSDIATRGDRTLGAAARGQHAETDGEDRSDANGEGSQN